MAGVAILVVLTSCGAGGNQNRSPSPPASTAPTAAATGTTPAVDPVTISSPAFADGAAIPVRYTCQGGPPPLAWSAPSSAAELALVVDDPDAPGGVFVHWIVTGIAPGPGSTADGQTPANGHTLPNSTGSDGYFAPCPPVGSGTHHYRFTMYQLATALQLPAGAADVQASHAIAQAATAQAQLTGTFSR